MPNPYQDLNIAELQAAVTRAYPDYITPEQAYGAAYVLYDLCQADPTFDPIAIWAK